MTKKHYIEIAADLKRLRESLPTLDLYVKGIDDATDLFVQAMQRDNPNFDRQRFLTAVGR